MVMVTHDAHNHKKGGTNGRIGCGRRRRIVAGSRPASTAAALTRSFRWRVTFEPSSNIAGQHVDIPTMEAFLASVTVQRVLPNLAQTRRNNPNDLQFFKGRFPRALAHEFYGDRFVLVGDSAGLVRAFKGKGVTSAVHTGIRAARAMLEAGISYRAFHDHYRQANQDIIRVLPYGRLMRHLTILASRYGLLDPVIRAAKSNSELQTALFGAVSGHALYRDILLQMLRPSIVGAVLREMARGDARVSTVHVSS